MSDNKKPEELSETDLDLHAGARIPSHTPEFTDHTMGDPGRTSYIGETEKNLSLTSTTRKKR